MSTPDAVLSRLSPRRVFCLTLLGSLLLQTAWILSVPAFRGIDEFDHVFKAESVAGGQLISRVPAEDGHGALLEVNEETVRAAAPVCEWYLYVGPDNCSPVKVLGDGRALAGSGAGSYNPVYYAVVGNAAKAFAGDTAVYAMRLVTALVCSLLIAWGASLTSGWARTRLPLLAYAAGVTPVLAYSTSVVSPNGLTYTGALLFWFAALALDRSPEDSAGALRALVVGAVAVLTSHTTGPVWLLVATASILMLRPVREWRTILGRRPVAWAGATLFAGLVAIACVAWTRYSQANSVGPARPDWDGDFPWAALARENALWAFQSIAAFPIRNQPAPLLVYVLWGAVLTALLVLLARRSTTRERLALGALLVPLLLLPNVLSYLTFPSQGFAWQGRYMLPLWVGVLALAARALDRGREAPDRILVVTAFATMAVANAVSVVSVAAKEADEAVSIPAAGLFPAGVVLVGVLAAVGSLLPALGLAWPERTRPTSPTGHFWTLIR